MEESEEVQREEWVSCLRAGGSPKEKVTWKLGLVRGVRSALMTGARQREHQGGLASDHSVHTWSN